MAIAFEGFCIREFASNMRTVDGVKSWPFGGDADMEQIESALPPITVPKFRWWQHEVEAARVSNASSSDAASQLGEKSEETLFGCTVCGGFKASGNENADIQAEMANSKKQQSTRARSKLKSPKKQRSIVEIFAVAPPIDTVTRQQGFSTGRNSESTRGKKKKKKTAALKKKHLPILDRKLKKKKVRRNASLAMKEICHTFKRKTASDLSRNLDRLRDKMCTSGTLEDAEGICKSNPNCKPSTSQRKHKNVAPSNFITKKQKAVVNPVRGILKKQSKYVSGKDTASTVPEKNCQVADQLEKHVKFLIENDKIDGEANPHAVTQQSNLHETLTGVDSVSRNDSSICVEELQVAKEKEVTLPDIFEQGNLKNYSLASTFEEDLNNFSELRTSPNQRIPKFCGDTNTSTKGKSVVSDGVSYPWHSRFLSTFSVTSPNADVAGSSVRPISFSSEFISSQQVGSSRAICGTSSVQRTRNTSPKSASLPSFLMNENGNDERLSFPYQSMMSSSSFISPVYQPARCPRQMNSFGGSFSCKEWNPIGAISSEKSLNENLYGLPLNSRGELSSSGNLMLDQQLGPPRCFAGQTAVQQRNASDSIRFKGNHTDKRSRQKDLNLFPIQVHADETPNSIPSRKGMSEPRGTIMENSGGRVNINPSSHLFGKDLNLMSQNGTNVAATATAPATMRLMGKDVSIGRISRIGFEEKVWTDKEIIVEHNNPSGPRFVKNFFPEKSGGLVNISYRDQNNSYHCRFPPSDPPRACDPYINWQPDATVQIGKVPITRNHHGGTFFHIESVRDPYLNGGPERLRVVSQIGPPFVPHESNWIDMQCGPVPRCMQNNVHAPRLPNSFGFPRGCFEESYWSRNNSFKEVVLSPSWLSHATSEDSEQSNTPYTPHHHTLPPFPDRQQQHLYGAPPATSWSSSSHPAFHLPEAYCCSYNPMASSQSQMRSTLGGFGIRDPTRASKRPSDAALRNPYKVPTLQVLHPCIDLSLSREEDTILRNVESCGAVLELGPDAEEHQNMLDSG